MNQELTPMDLLKHLRNKSSIIVIFGLLGLAVSTAFLISDQERYKATAIIEMGSFGLEKQNIESPTVLISHFNKLFNKLDTTIDDKCGDKVSRVKAGLGGKNGINLIQIGTDSIRINAIALSPEFAKACVNSIADYIIENQNHVLIQKLERMKRQLEKVNMRIAEDKVLLGANNVNRGQNNQAVFLLTDRLRSLEDERDRLFLEINAVVTNPHLVTPIDVSDKPIYPKKLRSLVTGLFGGLFLGVLAVIGFRVIASLRIST